MGSSHGIRDGWGGRLLAALALACLLALPRGAAWAVPSFAEQTGQPCAACHVGAFGPQLTQFGRDFKLNGYQASDGKPHFPPLAVTVQASFTHTNNNQPAPPAPRFGVNNNVALDQTSLYLAGKLFAGIGSFVQVTWDGVTEVLSLDNVDVRRSRDGELFGQDMVWGVTANNSPTVSDLWNSTPVWGFPYNQSPLAPNPVAATLIDGGMGQRVAGGGAYMMWNDLIYLEADAYRGLGYGALNAIGIVPVAGADQYRGLIPYWRLAAQQSFGRHYVQVGTYGLSASVLPGGQDVPGATNWYTDTALDANYQFTVDPKSVTSDTVSAHVTYIHENASMKASEVLVGSLPNQRLNTFRADVSYSIGATVTPTIQFFQTNGSWNGAFWGTPNGSPNSSGMIAEVAYVPWGKPDSPITWGNLRLAVQYVSYFRFNGVTHNAAVNDALFFSVWAAAHF